MKAISLWQPWASLWLSPRKVHETRHWPTAHRGWLLVHAAKRKMDDIQGDRLAEILEGEFGGHWGIDLPRGALIGRVLLEACRPTGDVIAAEGYTKTDDYECGDFDEGRWAGRKPEYDRGFRDGIRCAVTWLHGRAKEMNDPHAVAILNTAAFNLGADHSPRVAVQRAEAGKSWPATPERGKT